MEDVVDPDVPVEEDTAVAPDTGGPDDPQTLSIEFGGWTMAPGQETTRCAVFELSNPEKVHATAIHTKLAKGSHHLIVYRSSAAPTDGSYECQPFTDTLSSAPLMISEIAEETLQLPGGVALPLVANQRILVEAHYLNYYPEEITANAEVTFELMPEEDVVHTADMVLYGDAGFWVPPGAELTTDWTWQDMPNDTFVYGLTGHTHQWGTNVEVELSKNGASGTALYPGDTPFAWDEAPVVLFDPPLKIEKGDGFRIRCSYDNQSGDGVGFGLSANDEMCFMWAYYYPSHGYRLCAKGLFDFCPNDN